MWCDVQLVFSSPTGCHDVYSTEGERYACTIGCKTPTLDSTFPDRSHLYDKDVITEDSLQQEDAFIWQIWGAMISQANFFSSQEFEDLRGHAVEMEILIVPYRQYDFTVLTDDVSLVYV